MKTNHDETVTLNAYDTWISCAACGQRVTGDSIHTCSPQLKTLTDEEIDDISDYEYLNYPANDELRKVRRSFARAILRKAQEK